MTHSRRKENVRFCWAHLLVGRHASAPPGLSDVLSQRLVVVSSAGLLAEAPRLPVWIHAPQLVLTLSGGQLEKRCLGFYYSLAEFKMEFVGVRICFTCFKGPVCKICSQLMFEKENHKNNVKVNPFFLMFNLISHLFLYELWSQG